MVGNRLPAESPRINHRSDQLRNEAGILEVSENQTVRLIDHQNQVIEWNVFQDIEKTSHELRLLIIISIITLQLSRNTVALLNGWFGMCCSVLAYTNIEFQFNHEAKRSRQQMLQYFNLSNISDTLVVY